MSGQKLSKEEHSRTGKIKIVNLEFYAQQKYTSINEGEIEFFVDKLKWREFIISRPALQKGLMKVFQAEEKLY